MDLVNEYYNNEECVLQEFLISLDCIYDNNEIIKYLTEYHKKVDSFSFFIGLSEEELIDIHKPISYENFIMCEDWRITGGSNYYMIKRKLFTEYICLGDILEQLKDNSDCKRLLNNKDNDNIVLVSVNKKVSSNIHYELYFDNCL
jgi:apolipoprotein N-acyltransferase